MKAPFLLLLVAVLPFACQRADQSANQTTPADTVPAAPATEVANSVPAPAVAVPEWSDFELRFAYPNENNTVDQQLGIRWLGTDRIRFRLTSEDEMCRTESYGVAVNPSPGGDAETDETEEDGAYAVEEYVMENDTCVLSIRVAVDKDKARFHYTDKRKGETGCVPFSDLLLEKQKGS